ncbi:MAG: hypothetical protein RLZZ80_350, partial [Pseudomonadota bacterium]
MGSAATGFGGLGGLGIQALAIGLGAVLG